MATALRGLLTRPDRQRGSVTIWLATGSIVMITLVGLTVDLSGQVRAQQRARDVASQAARVGGQQLDGPLAVRGQGARADSGRAIAAAQTFLSSAEVSGSVVIEGGDTLIVTTTDTYDTQFLAIIGIGQMTVTGHARARIVRAVGGVEQ